jgi:hypothetical protein
MAFGEPFRKSLRCKLTEAEVTAYWRSFAQANKELEDLEGQKTQIVTDLKAQMARQEADVSIYRSRIREGAEYREVDCRWEVDNSENPPVRKHLVRQDTFDTIDTVRLSAEEIQELSHTSCHWHSADHRGRFGRP